MSKPTVLVTGGTGAQGGAVINELLKSGKLAIRVITRSPTSAKAESLRSRGVEVVQADLNDPASLRTALAGCDRAFLVTTFFGPNGVKGEEEEGKQFVAVAKEAGVKHLVFSSVGGADKAPSVPHFWSKYQIEQALRSSGIPSWSIIRPVAFMDNMPTEGGMARFVVLGVFGTLLAGKSLQIIAVRDIGWFAARALESPEEWNSKVTTLAGDDLDIGGIKEAYAKAVGHKPWAAWTPPASLLGPMMGKEMNSMFTWFKEMGYKADIAPLRKIHPDLLTFEQWLKSNKQQ